MIVFSLLLLILFIITVSCQLGKYNWCLYCIKKEKLCLDTLLFTNFKKDSSKRNAILWAFFGILILLTFLSNVYNIYLSERLTHIKEEYLLSLFWETLKKNYQYLLMPLDLLIIASYISSFVINKFIEKVFPLKNGIDTNSKEENTIIRFGSWCKLINNLDKQKIKEVSFSIGQEFGKSIDVDSLDLGNKESIKTLESKWNETDSDLARFHQRIVINSFSNSEIILEIIEPFWYSNFHQNCNINLIEYPKSRGELIDNLHKLCAFNFYYIQGILKNTKNFEELSLKCLNDKKCYLRSDRKCFFTVKLQYSN